MELSKVLPDMAIYMKENDYKKRNNSWRKELNDVAISVSIQKSRWSTQEWYICFGVTALSIREVNSFSATSYPIQDRLDGWKLTMEQVKFAVELWERKYGSIDKLIVAATENKLPVQSDLIVVRRLTSPEYLRKVFSSQD